MFSFSVDTSSPRIQGRSWRYSVYIRVFLIGVKETRCQPRDRKTSPLWQIFNRCYQAFEDMYDEKFEKRFGFFRAVIGESVRAFLKCGDLKQGFARIRCPNCGNEQILSYSCKKRCICGSCMTKRAIVFGHHLNENVFYPVPHRQYVFSIPIMLRVYFITDPIIRL